ncbi:MAG TPA: hypothetical protein VFX31_11155 [Ktedonobacterales bacterium]|nr:hypothetical protein [Ktedonobacterales bacterium]HEX5571940.1 hypothetical protein [Ktedonobacterales bacterium]
MARIRPTGAGKPRRTRRGAGTSKRGRHKAHHAAQHTARRAATARQATTTAPSAEHPAAGSAWSGMTTSSANPTPLLALRPDQMTHELATLALTGAQRATPHGALHQALQAWGAGRDQAANRAWRRPGGLTRMAGL